MKDFLTLSKDDNRRVLLKDGIGTSTKGGSKREELFTMEESL